VNVGVGDKSNSFFNGSFSELKNLITSILRVKGGRLLDLEKDGYLVQHITSSL